MVGGFIIGLAIGNDEALVHVQGSGCEENDTIACRCKHLGHALQLKDGFWWHGNKCYWTRVGGQVGRCGIDFDVPLPKVGYSHSHSHVGVTG